MNELLLKNQSQEIQLVNVQVPTLRFNVFYGLIHSEASFFAKLKHPENVVNFWTKRLILTK